MVLHDEHPACEHVDHQADGHEQETFEWCHISLSYAFATPGAVMVEPLDAEPAIRAVLSVCRILTIHYLT